jgi:hypothetical protein
VGKFCALGQRAGQKQVGEYVVATRFSTPHHVIRDVCQSPQTQRRANKYADSEEKRDSRRRNATLALWRTAEKFGERVPSTTAHPAIFGPHNKRA